MNATPTVSTKTVKGDDLGSYIMTEDGSLAQVYPTLTEVTVKNGHIAKSYYFVHKENAKEFIRKEREKL